MQPRTSSQTRTGAAFAFACAVVPFTGCKPTEFNQVYAPTQSRSVDPSWIAAAKHCWPAIDHDGYSNSVIEHQLADPLHFRATFAAYAALPNASLLDLIAHPVSAAPALDAGLFANSHSPVLTRAQALNGAPTDSQMPAGGTTPPDPFCTLQTGMPVGFR